MAFALNMSAPYGLETHLGWLDTPQGTTGPLERCYLVPAPAWHGVSMVSAAVCKGSEDVGDGRPWQMLVCGYRSGQTSRRPSQPLTLASGLEATCPFVRSVRSVRSVSVRRNPFENPT